MRWLCYRYCSYMVYHLCVENYPSPDMCLARDRIAIALPFCIAMFRRCFNQSVSLFCPVFSAIGFINENVIIYGDKPTFKYLVYGGMKVYGGIKPHLSNDAGLTPSTTTWSTAAGGPFNTVSGWKVDASAMYLGSYIHSSHLRSLRWP